MAWPDLFIVPEGAVSNLTWHAGAGLADQPVKFLTSGSTSIAADDVRQALSGFVHSVLERLDEAGVSGTPLQKEWEALASLDDEEREFAIAAARLGLDPFDVQDAIASTITRIGDSLERDLLLEFLDSAMPDQLQTALDWLRKAQGNLPLADEPIPRAGGHAIYHGRPWVMGYAGAKRLRSDLALEPTDRIAIDRWVAVARMSPDSGGLQGLVGVNDDRVGLVLPDESKNTTTVRFAQSRAVGHAILSDRRSALLDPARTDSGRMSRAFAAELLAPADGIQAHLHAFGDYPTERAVDHIAHHYGVSPMLVQHQFDNQISNN